MMIAGRNLPVPESPQAKFWAWVIAIVIGTASALVMLDATFARKAEAINKAEVDGMILAATSALGTSINLNVEYAADQNAKRAIDQQLFVLEQRLPNLSPQDRAVYQKLLRDRAELVDLWNRRGRPLR